MKKAGLNFSSNNDMMRYRNQNSTLKDGWFLLNLYKIYLTHFLFIHHRFKPIIYYK